jgi:twitching motility protein PilJ
MSDVKPAKPTLFKRRPASPVVTATAVQGAPARRSGLLENTPFGVKLIFITLAVALGTLAVFLAALQGFGALQRGLTDSYEKVLNPTKALDQALLNFADAQRYFVVLGEKTITPEQRQSALEIAQQAVDTAEAQVNLYQSQYATSTRPDFVQVLNATGRSDFINDERSALSSLNAILQETKAVETSFLQLAATGAPPPSLTDAVVALRGQARGKLQDLVDVNDSFSSVQRDLARDEANRAVQLMIAVLVTSLLVGGLLVSVIVRSIVPRLAALERTAREMRGGNLEMTVPVAGRDEIGSVGSTLNASIAQLREFVRQQEEERTRGMKLQQNVSQFLDVAMRIAQGDLTQKGAVTEDALGNVVDAINVMTEEIGYLLKDVQQTAQAVSTSAETMNVTSKGILDEAQAQANIADLAQAQTVRVTTSIQQLAQTAERGAQTARETLQASTEGQRAVTNTVAQLFSIRDEMNAIASGTQSLERRSAEITEVLRTISRFASQTNLLALGASLEAAGAGEAGARFAAVATAVRGLADESAKAATRVASLVKDVQSEIASLAQLAQSGSEQAQAGASVAQEASARLKRIAELADESAVAASAISSLAEEQVQNVQSVRSDVQRIAQTAQQTENQSRGGQSAAAQLQALSEGLTRSLERFRLPA